MAWHNHCCYGAFRLILVLVLVCLGSFGGPVPQVAAAQPVDGTSLRFFGSGPGDHDRVKIPLGPISDGQISNSLPVNVANDFTVEFWVRAEAAENTAPACEDRGWYYGNIIIDRDVDGPGDYGDYGVALCAGRIAFGVNVGEDERMVFGTTPVANGQWRHIAVTRADGGALTIFVDGQLDGQREGPRGRIDYRTNRATSQPDSDPYLVLGAEKHDYDGSFYYNGLLDDLHLSNQVRYNTNFARPTLPHQPDAATVALYRFDEGTGTSVGDSSGAPAGPSDGVLMVGGPAGGPLWASDTPFQPLPSVASAAPAPTSGTPQEPTSEPDTVQPTSPPLPTESSEPNTAQPTSPLSPTESSEPNTAQPTSPPSPTESTPPSNTALPSPLPSPATPDPAPLAATPTDQPHAAIVVPGAAPPPADNAQHSNLPPPPGGPFSPMTWSLIVAGLGLVVSLTTVLLWRRRV